MLAGSTDRQILAAALTIGGAAAIVALASMTRELLVAARFGTDDALDAFIVAVALPTFVVNVFGGSFAAALVPTFVRVQEKKGEAAAQRVFSGVLALGLGLLVVAAVLLAALSPILLPPLASGFAPEKLHLTEHLFRLYLPVVVIGGIAQMLSAVLNAGQRFALAALSQGLIPLTTIFALLVGGEWGINALLAGVVGGFALRLCVVGVGLSRQGFTLKPRWAASDTDVRQVFAQYVPMVIGAALLGSAALIDQAIAATLAPGSVSALAYGTKAVALVTGLGSAALGTSVLPFFSRMVAAAEWGQVRQTVRTFSALTLLATVAMTLILLGFSRPIVEFVFQRGAFTEADTALVAQVQALYALQLPFFGVGILFVRLISSLGGNRVLMWQAAICLPINAVLDVLFARTLGVAGIALATSVMYLVSFCILLVMSRRLLERATAHGAASMPDPEA